MKTKINCWNDKRGTGSDRIAWLIAVLSIFCFVLATPSLTAAPLIGTKTIDNTLPTSGNNYASFTAAIGDLNTNGVGAGGVTFNVTSGQAFVENTPEIIATGTAANPIVFRKLVGGANPVIRPSGATGTQEFGIGIKGGDFITFDGIDIAITGGSAVAYGYRVRNASATDGATNNTIQNTSITLDRTNIRSRGIMQSSSGLEGNGVSTANPAGANSNNRYYNLTIQNAYSGVYLYGGAVGETNNEVGVIGGGTTVIGGPAPGDIGGGNNAQKPSYGIRAYVQASVKIFGTEVRNVSARIGAFGISLEETKGTSEISRCKVHGIRSTSATSAGAYGIRTNFPQYMSNGHTIRIYNNFLWDILTAYTEPAAEFTGGVRGILLQSNGAGEANTFEVDFNSVRIDLGANLNMSSTAFMVSGAAVVRVRNNIFANITGAQAGVAKHYTWIGPATFPPGWISDRNDLYIANPINGFVGLTYTAFEATDRATLADWQAATGQDANSISVNPQFLSATDLHIAAGSPAVDQGSYFGGAITWAGRDIDLQDRVPPPDIGADEPGGITPVANDIAATGLVTPTNNGVFPVGATLSPQASFTNVGVNGQSNIAVQFSITGPGGYSYLQPGQIASINPDQTITVTFAAAPAFTAPGTYNMSATVLTSDQNPGNDQIIGAFQVINALSGSYDVPGNFPSLTNPGGVFDAFDAVGASGNVVINIVDDLSGETGAKVLNQVAGGFSVTIKPSGAARTITSTASAVSVIKLNDADNVTIDGSLSGGTDRSLTIANTNPAQNTAVIWVGSATNGAQNNTIKNTNLSAGAEQTDLPLPFTCGIVSSASSSLAVGATDNDGNSYRNNFIQKANIGIRSVGVSTENQNQNTVIADNTIGPAALGPDQIGAAGILIHNENLASITDNEVRFVGDSVNSAGGETGDRVGIMIGGLVVEWPTVDRAQHVLVTNSTIKGNLVHDIVNRGRSSAAGIVENATYDDSPTGNVIANNMIYNVLSNGQGDRQAVGIGIANGNGDTVAFNSVYLAGDIDPPGSIAATNASFGISVQTITSSVLNLSLRDNIAMMDLTSDTVELLKAAVHLPTSLVWGSGGSNNNDWFAVPGNPQAQVGATTTPLNARTFYATLASWQAATGQDANSLSIDPLFLSATNLHLQGNSSLVNAGVAFGGILSDFDGNVRPQGAGYEMGADEVKPPTIAAASGLTRQQGSPAANSIVATLENLRGEADSAAVTVNGGASATINGVTVSNIVNSNGIVTANVGANCSATDASFTLNASAGGLSTMSTLNVSVTGNTPPILTYANTSTTTGRSRFIIPASGPIDNGFLSTIVLQSAGTYTGGISIANGTGTITISNAVPAGTHTITIRATDNCGAITDATFTLTIRAAVSLDVTNVNDSGAGSLRQALADAEVGDTVNFSLPKGAPTAPNGAAIITLTNGELLVDQEVTINGPGADRLIIRPDPNAAPSRVFHVNTGQGAAPSSAGGVVIRGLTISDGFVLGSYPEGFGGGIFCEDSDLAVTACALIGNSAPEGFGGGIMNVAFNGIHSLTITDSTFSQNVAAGGGGLMSDAAGGGVSASVINSTFSENSAPYGGGIAHLIELPGSAQLYVGNSTFSGNSSAVSGGAIYLQRGPGGSEVPLQVANSIFHENGAPGGTIANNGDTVTSFGHNIASDAGVTNLNGGTGGLFGAGDQINTNPMLAPLADNGGPTETHALLANSTAINNGNEFLAPVYDQRGYLRSGVSDIGAFEFNGAAAPVNVVSRKTHGGAGTFDIDLPISGLPASLGIECRTGGLTNDYELIVTYPGTVTLNSSPQAQITSGAGVIGSGGMSNGGVVAVSGNAVTIPLTNVSSDQILNVSLNGVNGGGNLVIPMGVLVGDIDGSGSVNASDIGQTKAQSGQAVSASNFRVDLNANGAINASDIGVVKSKSGAFIP